MKNKYIRYIFVALMLVFVGSIYTAVPCLAASAEVELNADSTEVTVGDNFMVYLTIDSDTSFGDFEANLLYNEGVLEYQGGSSSITGGSGFLKISDVGVTEYDTSRKYTMKFEATQVGICQISFDDRAVVYDDSGYEMSVSNNVVTINVKAKETASENAYLESLKISSAELAPAFDKKTYEYSTIVGFETEQLIINAIPEDKKASISTLGNDSLKEGGNKVIITVVAESGTVIEYTINVTRENAPEEIEDVDNDITKDTDQSSFEIIRNDGKKYVIYSGNYELIEPDSTVIIPNGYIKTKLIVSDISITAYSPKDNMESDFLLIYAKDENGKEGFYQYDRIEKTLQRYISKGQYNVSDILEEDTDEIIRSEEYKKSLNKAAVVIALLCAFSVLLVAVIVRLILRIKGYKDDDL